MNKDLMENSLSAIKLKAFLFDIISENTTNKGDIEEKINNIKDNEVKTKLQNALKDKKSILNNIIEKGNALVEEVEKIDVANALLEDFNKGTVEEKDNSASNEVEEKAKEETTPEQEVEVKEDVQQEIEIPTTPVEEIANETEKQETPSEEPQQEEITIKEVDPPQPANQESIVFSNDEEDASDEEKETEEVEEEEDIEENYPQVKLQKKTNDPPRAIIVSKEQYQRLLASKIRQKNLIIQNELEESEQEENAPSSNEVIPTEDTDLDLPDITTSENPTPEEKQEPEEVIPDNTEEKEETIEEMLERANNLYKEGNLQESEALYEKISSLNKTNQEKILTKAA